MSRGYNRPLYLLPFDHRHSYVTGMFNFNPPLTVNQHEAVADSKRVIYDGFRQALGKEVPIASAAILVDEDLTAAAGVIVDRGALRAHVSPGVSVTFLAPERVEAARATADLEARSPG